MGEMQSVMQGLVQRSRMFAAQARQKIQERRKRRRGYQLNQDEAYVMAKLDEMKRVRLATLEAFEPIWTRSILYCAGVQHLRYLSTTRQYEPVKAEDWLPLPVINEIQPKVQRAVDFFTRNRPRGACVPEDESETAKEAAEYGDAVLRHIWELNDEEEKNDEAATWMVVTGNTFKKHYVSTTPRMRTTASRFQAGREPLIDEQTGQPRMDPETGMPLATERYVAEQDEQGMPSVDFESPTHGIETEIFGPVHMVVPLAAPRFDDAPWIAETSIQPLHELRMLYQDKADFIGETARVVTSDLYQHRILSLLTSGLHGVIRSLDPYTLDGYGIVYQYEMAPDPEFPNGLLVVEFDGIPLEIAELPRKTRYSYEHCGYYRVPGRFWYRGMVEDLIDPQDQINKLEQFLRVNDDHNAQATWLVPHQAEIPQGGVSNKPGLVIRYQYPFEPKPVQGVPMPAQIVQRRAMYQEDIEELSGVRNVLMGNAPGGVTAGVALNRLREEAEGLFEPIAKRWHRFVERGEEAKLDLVAKYWTVPQHLTVAGEDGNLVEVKDFVGSMLGNVRKFRVESGSWRPISHAGQQELAMEMFGSGLLPAVMTDPEQHRRFLELMGLDGFDAEQSLDYKRALRENEMLCRSTGWERVMRQAGDDDLVHLAVHAADRKKPKWERLPGVVRRRYILHEVEHLEAVMAAGGMPDMSSFAGRPEALEGTDAEEQPGEESGGNGDMNKQQQPGGGPDATA